MDPPLRWIKLVRRYGNFGKSGDLAVVKEHGQSEKGRIKQFQTISLLKIIVIYYHILLKLLYSE